MPRSIARISRLMMGATTALWFSACQHSLTAALGASTSSSGPDRSTVTPPRPSPSGDASAASITEPPTPPDEDPNATTNSRYASATDPEPTARDIARANGHRWTRLVGYSVAEASARARAAGFSGKIEVGELSEFDPRCKADMVCTFHPQYWESGDGGPLRLMLNRKLVITTPE